VGRALILESTFLVDLERETRRGEDGPAHRFLADHPDDALYLTFTVAGELAAGVEGDGRARWEELVAPFHVLGCSLDVCWHYGQLERHLREVGLLIGSNDLWIAATGVAHSLPVVTANERHYRRVPGLVVVGYRDDRSPG
jgi:predicted nucleic acid-binding protein